MEPSESPMLLLVITLFTLLSVALVLKRCFTTQTNLKSNNKPPSPTKLPVIGNLHQLGSLPHRSLRSLALRHGPFMLLHFGSTPVLVVSSADAARLIMKTHDHVFANRPKTKAVEKLMYNYRDIAFAPYGEYWRQIKSICVIHMLSNKMVRSFRNVREEEIRVMMNKIDQSVSTSSPINLTDIFGTLSNDVVCRIAMGRKYGSGGFVTLLNKAEELLGVFNIGDYIPWLGWVSRMNGLDSELNRVAKLSDEIIEKEIRERLSRTDDDDGKSKGEPLDFIDILLRIRREKTVGFEIDLLSIKALILDVFIAGTDTTFAVLVWTMTELLRNPQIMAKLQEEVRTVTGHKPHVAEDDLHKMSYLKAVFKESLRLHPPAPLLVPRQSTENVNLQGYDIAIGTQVYINAWAIGRDPAAWGEDAEEFRPERFMNSSMDYRGADFELIPFGAGRRSCPGMAFSTAVYELALANAIYRFDWRVAGGSAGDIDTAETFGLTSHRKSPLVAYASK